MKTKMNDDETFEFEGRRYLAPAVSRDEQLDFVNTLRDTVGANTAQIAESTERLGTNIPSSMGGLTGSGSYFTQRYQTTPLETRANTLKATAQAKALNDLISNYEKQYANRAQQAYRNAARRASTADTVAENPLEITTNEELKDTIETVDTTDWQTQLNRLNSEPSGQLYYLSYQPPYREPVKTYVNNLTSGDDSLGRVRQLGTGTNGEIKTIGGVRYIYIDDGRFAPSWYRVGAQGTFTPGGGQ